MDAKTVPSSWYHGSPEHLETLRTGSTITQNRRLAEVFSHKPGMVSVDGDGSIKHNGMQSGILYHVTEQIAPADVIPHSHTTMVYGQEWLTTRELHLTVIRPTHLTPEELLTSEEVDRLGQRLRETSQETSPK